MILAVVAAVASVAPARVTTSPTLDGRLDDAAWASATAFTAFVQKNPDAGAPASEPTSVRIVYDDDALWIGIDCVQQRSPIVRRLTRRDRDVDADRVEVDLDSRATGRDAFHFAVNAAGVLGDALRFDDTELDTNWDENWDARVALTATGWSAELRIPFRILRYARVPDARWGLQVRRFISARQETDELAPIPRGEAGETSRYGTLGPFAALPDHASVELRPFVLAALERATDGGLTPRASLGGDLKWHATPTLTVDATINPDFAQVEADQRVLNLTTYETFYPEKRPFFLEGTGLFAAPIQVLYTRRIGRRAPDPVLPAGEAATALVQPSPVWGAAKLTGGIGDDTQLGALAAVTGAQTVATADATGSHDRVVDPTAVYGALRVRRGLGSRGYFGAFATGVARFETGGYPQQGAQQLCPDGNVVVVGARCSHDAVVAGLDGRWRSSSGAYLLDADVAASTIHGGPARVQRDGIAIGSGDTSPQGRVRFAKEDNGAIFDLLLEADGRRFDPNEAGYLERANFIHGHVNVGWKDTTPGKLVRERTSHVEAFYWRNWRGERIDGGILANTDLQLKNYWSVFGELYWRPSHFDDREVGGGTSLQHSGRLGWEQAIGGDPRGRVVGTWFQSLSFLHDAFAFTGDGDITIHALPQLDVEVLPSIVVVRGERRYAFSDGTGVAVFGRQDALAAGVTLRTTYTFTPRTTLQLYGQLFGDRVTYRDFGVAARGDPQVLIDALVRVAAPSQPTGASTTTVNASAVFRWEWRLGSTLFAVYSRSQNADRAFDALADAPIPWRAGLAARSYQVLLVKLAYWWG